MPLCRLVPPTLLRTGLCVRRQSRQKLSSLCCFAGGWRLVSPPGGCSDSSHTSPSMQSAPAAVPCTAACTGMLSLCSMQLRLSLLFSRGQGQVLTYQEVQASLKRGRREDPPP